MAFTLPGMARAGSPLMVRASEMFSKPVSVSSRFESWKMKPKSSRRNFASWRFDMPVISRPPTMMCPLVTVVDGRDAVQKRCFAGARGAHDADELAGGHVEADTGQRVGDRVAAAEDFFDGAHREDGGACVDGASRLGGRGRGRPHGGRHGRCGLLFRWRRWLRRRRQPRSSRGRKRRRCRRGSSCRRHRGAQACQDRSDAGRRPRGWVRCTLRPLVAPLGFGQLVGDEGSHGPDDSKRQDNFPCSVHDSPFSRMCGSRSVCPETASMDASRPSGDGYAAFRFAQTVLAGIEGVGVVRPHSRAAFDTICGTRSVGTPRIRLLHLTDHELEFILKRRRAWFHRSGLRLTYECVRLRGFLPVSTCAVSPMRRRVPCGCGRGGR